jgi:hypothetical protein
MVSSFERPSQYYEESNVQACFQDTPIENNKPFLCLEKAVYSSGDFFYPIYYTGLLGQK